MRSARTPSASRGRGQCAHSGAPMSARRTPARIARLMSRSRPRARRSRSATGKARQYRFSSGTAASHPSRSGQFCTANLTLKQADTILTKRLLNGLTSRQVLEMRSHLSPTAATNGSPEAGRRAMRVFVASGLVVLVVISGCASQMTREKAKEHCAAQGKRPFIAEAEQQGVPLFIESANVLFYCVGPDDILSTPAAFGAEIVGGADLHGVGVMTVSSGSIADKAGLKAGDIL